MVFLDARMGLGLGSGVVTGACDRLTAHTAKWELRVAEGLQELDLVIVQCKLRVHIRHNLGLVWGIGLWRVGIR